MLTDFFLLIEMRDKLRKWREENYRNSEQIVEVGEELIQEHASKLGDDIWIIYEQVMIAALECSRDDLATTCLHELKKQFQGSHRVKRLAGMRLEALERYSILKIKMCCVSKEPTFQHFGI
ncbi:UNVERIFIED_CONTAM: hypothetical protein FKN15_059444 [Acipenser sinensis]